MAQSFNPVMSLQHGSYEGWWSARMCLFLPAPLPRAVAQRWCAYCATVMLGGEFHVTSRLWRLSEPARQNWGTLWIGGPCSSLVSNGKQQPKQKQTKMRESIDIIDLFVQVRRRLTNSSGQRRCAVRSGGHGSEGIQRGVPG